MKKPLVFRNWTLHRVQKVNTCSESEHISHAAKSASKIFSNFILLQISEIQVCTDSFLFAGIRFAL